MATMIPQKNDFDKAQLSERYSKGSVYIVVFISLLNIILNVNPSKISTINDIMAVLALLAGVAKFYFQWQFELSYRQAEETRRNGLIDDSFETKSANTPSEGYYDTKDIEHGIKKLLSNIHENSLFSSKITYAMFKKTEIRTLIMIGAIFTIALLNFLGSQSVVAVVDMFLSLDLLRDYLKLKKLQNDLENVQTSCKYIWNHYSSKRGKAEMKTTAEIIRVVIKYETSLAYASLMFDNNIFRQLNSSITSEWEEVKKRFCK